jgi:hypothetical protein
MLPPERDAAPKTTCKTTAPHQVYKHMPAALLHRARMAAQINQPKIINATTRP